jgi:outer membrane protein OmpA-like peptidoglycan-associated protein
MSSKLILLIALAGLLVLGAVDVGVHGHFSDRHYRKQVEKALERAKYNTPEDKPITATVDDRWCVLEGAVRDPKDREQLPDAVLRRVRGLRGLTNNVKAYGCDESVLDSLKEWIASDPEEAQISYVIDPPCTITLTGWVSTEEMKAGIGAVVAATPGVGDVRNNLEVRLREQEVINALIGILRVQNIYFDHDLTDIRPESLPAFDEIAALLNEQAHIGLRIEGHTDSVGGAEYNLKLSEGRAEAVRSELVERGVAADRLEAVGYGEEQPIANNDAPEGRAENRRIEFKVL